MDQRGRRIRGGNMILILNLIWIRMDEKQSERGKESDHK